MRIDAGGEIYHGFYYGCGIHKRKRIQHCDTYSDIPLCTSHKRHMIVYSTVDTPIVTVTKKQNA